MPSKLYAALCSPATNALHLAGSPLRSDMLYALCRSYGALFVFLFHLLQTYRPDGAFIAVYLLQESQLLLPTWLLAIGYWLFKKVKSNS